MTSMYLPVHDFRISTNLFHLKRRENRQCLYTKTHKMVSFSKNQFEQKPTSLKELKEWRVTPQLRYIKMKTQIYSETF